MVVSIVIVVSTESVIARIGRHDVRRGDALNDRGRVPRRDELRERYRRLESAGIYGANH